MTKKERITELERKVAYLELVVGQLQARFATEVLPLMQPFTHAPWHIPLLNVPLPNVPGDPQPYLGQQPIIC